MVSYGCPEGAEGTPGRTLIPVFFAHTPFSQIKTFTTEVLNKALFKTSVANVLRFSAKMPRFHGEFKRLATKSQISIF